MTSLLWTNNGIFYLINSAQGSTFSSVKRGKITGNPKVLVDWTFIIPTPPTKTYYQQNIKPRCALISIYQTIVHLLHI